MGTKYAEKAVVRDAGLNRAFQEGFGEARAGATEYIVVLTIDGQQEDTQTFSYLDGALAWVAEHLHKGEGHEARIKCRAKATAPVPELTDDGSIVDAEIVEE